MALYALKGISVSPGFALGPAQIHATSGDHPVTRLSEEQVDPELNRLDAALARAEDTLRRNIRFATEKVGEQHARILESQLAFLGDVELRDRARREVRERLVDPASAIDRVLAEYARKYEKHLPVMRRDLVAQVRDAWGIVLGMLRGIDTTQEGRPAVIVTDELVPSFATWVERGALAAVIAEAGGRYSHGAILARSFGVPAVVGLRELRKRVRAGMTIAVNGDEGTVLLEPSEAEAREFESQRIARIEQRRELQGKAIQPARTNDGVAVAVMANVERVHDLDAFDLRTVDGVGLYRTEFLYLDSTSFPTEDDQLHAYKRVLDRFKGRPVVFRTLDAGGDKPLPYFEVPKEQNPALGWRGIRVCLDMPDVFVPQLRALLRAAAHGDARILIPMVTSVDEMRAVRSLIASIAADLKASGVKFRADVPVGAMIEVPAAAITIDAIADVADFVSLGTNDLVQYLLGVDRDNPRVGSMYDPYQPGVLRTIARVVEAAKARGRDVSICGELASDPHTTALLLGFGLRSLSMAPVAVAGVKAAIRALSMADAQALAASVLTCGAASEVRERIAAWSSVQATRVHADPVGDPPKEGTGRNA